MPAVGCVKSSCVNVNIIDICEWWRDRYAFKINSPSRSHKHGWLITAILCAQVSEAEEFPLAENTTGLLLQRLFPNGKKFFNGGLLFNPKGWSVKSNNRIC